MGKKSHTHFKRALTASTVLAACSLLHVPTSVAQQSAQQIAVEEITVTARKRDESIYEIPVSVSAFSAEMLERAGLDNAQDLSEMTPGLDFRQIGDGGRFNPNIRVRGMIQQAITPSTQIGALFWDGSYIGGGGSFVPLRDLERVEVIKGPQTAYFGRNTFAGAINYIPKRPGDEWEGDLDLRYSPTGHDEYTVSGAVGGPITDTLGVRVSAGYERDGGDFSFDDGEPFGQLSDLSLSGMMVFNPIEDLELRLSGYWVDAEDTSTGAGVNATVPPGSCGIIYNGESINLATGETTPFQTDLSQSGRDIFCGQFPNQPTFEFPISRFPTQGQLANGATAFPMLTTLNPLAAQKGIIQAPEGGLGGWHRAQRIQLAGSYEVADHTLDFVYSRANTGTTIRIDAFYGNATTSFPPFSPIGADSIFAFGVEIAIREFYYEARVSSPQDQRFRYLVGASKYNQHYRNFQDISRPTAPNDLQNSETIGVFGSFDYDITDTLTLSAEGRWQDEELFIKFNGNPLSDCSAVATICGDEGEPEALESFSAFIPRVILSYEPMDGATAYVSWSQSKLLGIATQAAFVASVAPDVITPAEAESLGNFTPAQKATQFEGGWKQQWDDWNMTLAVYHTRWENQPIPAVLFLPSGGTTSFRAPGESVYRGFDFEFNGTVNDWMTLSGSIGYVDAQMIRFANFGSSERFVLGSPGPLLSDGNPPRQTPPWTMTLSPTVFGTIQERDWFLRGDFIYTDKFFGDYSAYNQNPERILVNLRAGLDIHENLSVELFGYNIFNDLTVPTTASTTGSRNFDAGRASRKIFTAVPQAREFGLQLRARF